MQDLYDRLIFNQDMNIIPSGREQEINTILRFNRQVNFNSIAASYSFIFTKYPVHFLCFYTLKYMYV